MQNFSLSALVKSTFEDTKKHFFVLIGLILSVLLGNILVQLFVELITKISPFIGSLLSFGFMLVQAYITLGLTNICLLIARGKDYETRDLFVPVNQLFRYLKVVVLVVFGAMLLIAPLLFTADWQSIVKSLQTGVRPDVPFGATFFIVLIPTLIVFLYLALRLSFYLYLILESDFSTTEIISESFKMTKGRVGILLLCLLTIIGLNIIGLLLLVIGLCFTVPMSYILMARLYTIIADEQYPDQEEQASSEDIVTE